MAFDSQKLETPEASTKLSIVGNVILLILKFIGGFLGGSKALIADFVNSLLDLVANAAVLIGVRVAQQPADADHQYGHGNADVIAAFLVAVIILMTGIYIGYDSASAAFGKNYKAPHWYATLVAIITIFSKTMLYRFTKKVGIKSKSPAVFANAQDHKSDVYASSGALFGIVMAQLGYPVLDPIGGIWVSFFVVRNSINLIRDNIHTLMSGAPDRETIDGVRKADVAVSPDGMTWSAPAPVDPYPNRGHQFMPSIACTANRATLLWYDQRFDNAPAVFGPIWFGFFIFDPIPRVDGIEPSAETDLEQQHIGGRARELRVEIDPTAMAARNTAIAHTSARRPTIASDC